MGEMHEDVLAYLPASLARRALGGKATELPWRLEVDGTMVMADLSGFTALSERLARLGDEGAERLTDIINSFFERMLKTASGYGGDTLTFGGDAILLLFEGPDHATRAAVAALEMLRQVERAAAVEAGGGKVKIGMSVGAHSDRFALAGVGLDGERAHLVVLGRGGEMAALAEAQAERGQLAVSAACKQLLPAGSGFEPSGDFWLVDEIDPTALSPPDAEAPELSDEALRQLDHFLPPYARAADRRDRARDSREPVRLTPEHRRTVMVFVDVLGLDEVIVGRGLGAAVEQLQAYAEMLTRLATMHNGFVVSSDIATKGSKFVITFGAPVAHEYAPANAARFALDLTAGLRASGLDVHHKVGVNGGHVFAGEVGPVFRRQYTVMGDAVNLAARLMAAAELDTALISRNLLSYVSHTVCARELPPITVKGKERPVAVCVLEEEGVTEGQIRGEQGLARPQGRLFGRRKELDLLDHAWESARRSGAGKAIFIGGEAGVGKTRLLDEALRSISATGEVVRAACFEHLQAAPYVPWVDVLQAVLGIAPDDPADDRTARVLEYLERHLADWVEFGPLLDPLLGLALPRNRVVDSLEPQSRRRRMMDLMTGILLADISETGRVVVIEDVHWADESSLALVEHVSRRVAESPVLLIFTSRPAAEAAALQDDGMTRLKLTELSRSQSLAMVGEALDAADLPVEVGDAIYAKTRGNPLFLEEVVNSLRRPGVLERILGASTVTRAAELAALEIPDRVQGLLMSRVDGLSGDARELLRAGAVAGRSFDTRVLRSIGDPRLRHVPFERALDELSATALVVREDDLGSRATFRHALVQDVAYDSLPFARRRELHGEIARYLESTQSPPDHALLVHHYHRAGDRERSRVHAVRASADSAATYANREAVDYLSIALGTVRGRRPVDACLRSRFEELEGDSLQTFGSHEEAVRVFLAARKRWAPAAVRESCVDALDGLSPVDDVESRDSLLCWKASVSMQRGPGEFKRAIRWLDIGMRGLPPGRTDLTARILIAKTVCLCRLARNREALKSADQGLAIAREGDDMGLVAYASSIRSLALSQLGRWSEAVESSREAIRAYEEAGDLVGEALAHANLAMASQLMDDPKEGLQHSERALAIYVKLGDQSGIIQQQHSVGACLLQLGEFDEAIPHLEQTVGAFGTDGCPPLPVGWAYVLLAEAHLLRDDPGAADRALSEGWKILSSIDAEAYLLDTKIVEAEVDLAYGRLGEARRKCEEVVTASRAVDAVPVEGEALRVLGRVGMAEGRPEAAVANLELCLALADETGSQYARALALVVLAEAQAACAERDPSCEDRLGEAIRLFRRMGIRHELEKALELRSRMQQAAMGGPLASASEEGAP
jgi:class 3 adenylate cyclase/tetratricopeptide (TPR) repeat protein